MNRKKDFFNLMVYKENRLVYLFDRALINTLWWDFLCLNK